MLPARATCLSGQLEGSKDLPSNKALPVVLMCPTGARAGRAAGLLRKAGYERAVAVTGGTKPPGAKPACRWPRTLECLQGYRLHRLTIREPSRGLVGRGGKSVFKRIPA